MWKLGPSLLSALLITINVGDVYSQKPRLGDGIRIFRRMNSIRENARVLPKSGNEGWFFREPTVQLFEDPEALPKIIHPEMALNEFDFHYKFCANTTQLLQAYFHGFKINGTHEPWKVFAKDWSTSAIANFFGIAEWSITSGDNSFFLMKIEKSRDNQSLAENVVLNNENSKIIIDPKDGPINFFTIPTHFINAYATGNAVYQVFVLPKNAYEYFENEMRGNGLGVYSERIREIFFSPRYIADVGRIRTASGNSSVETWASKNLRFPFLDDSYSSLMKVYRNATLLNQLDKLLEDEVLLQLEMPSLVDLLERHSR